MSDSDQYLWRVWQAAGDDHAFETLVRPHLRFATDLARRHGCRPDEADDVVQEALTKLAQTSGPRPIDVGLRPWLARTVRLQTLMLHRANRRRSRREQRYAATNDTRSGDARGADEVEGALAQLSDARREAVVLRHLHDLEYREMAQVLAISETACRLRVHKAIGELRRLLGREPGSLLTAIPLLGGVRTPESLAHAATAATVTKGGAALLLGALAMKKILILSLLVVAGVGAVVVTSDSDGPSDTMPPKETPLAADVAPGPALVPRSEPAPAIAPESKPLPEASPKHTLDFVNAILEAGGQVLIDRGAGKTPARVTKAGTMPPGDLVGLSIPGDKAEVLLMNTDALGDLRWLEINSSRKRGAGLSDEQLIEILGHMDLHHLELSRNPVSDAGLTAIADQRHLTSLTVSNLRITDGGLMHLGRLHDLEELDIHDNKLSNAALAHLSALRLRRIAFGETDITDAGLVHLKDMQLEQIELHEHDDINGRGFSSLDLSRLEIFDADESGDIDDSVMEALSRAPLLKELILKETKVSDKGLKHIKGARSIEKLDLNDTNISSAGIEHLVGMPNLRHLNLNETAIGDDAIPYLVRMSSLERLTLRETRITKDGLARLREALPECNIRND